MVTAALMPSIISGSLIRATPPSRRISAGTRSRAITAVAPASWAITACSGVTTSMITPPLSISANPRFTAIEPLTWCLSCDDMGFSVPSAGCAEPTRATNYGNLTVAGSTPGPIMATFSARATSTKVRPGVNLITAPPISRRIHGSMRTARSHVPS